MGAKCGTFSGEIYYKSINFQKFRNHSDLNSKYSYRNKVFSKSQDMKTILVYDMIFQKYRILKQVRIPIYYSYSQPNPRFAICLTNSLTSNKFYTK